MKKEKVLPKYKYKFNGAQRYSSLVDKYLNEMRHLAPTVIGWNFLDTHQRAATIHYACLYFTKGLERKEMDKVDFIKYKNYMYIILKNEIAKTNISVKQTHRAAINSIFLAETDSNEFYDDDVYEDFDYKQALTKLNEQEQLVASELINGYNQNEIRLKLGLTGYMINTIVKSIRKKIFPHMKPRLAQYQTRADFHRKKQTPNPSSKYIDYEYDDFYS